MKRFVLLFCLCFFTFPTLGAQDSKDKSRDKPVPYKKEEFPQWAHDARRFEVIAFGSFPLTYMLGSLGYGLYNVSKGEEGNFSLFGDRSQEDYEILLITAASLSLGVAVADLIIGKIKAARKKKAQREYSYVRPKEDESPREKGQ